MIRKHLSSSEIMVVSAKIASYEEACENKELDMFIRDLQDRNLNYYNQIVMFKQCCEDAIHNLKLNNIQEAANFLQRALNYSNQE